MLLRHQPRFNYYSRFFHALANVSAELLSTAVIPTPQPLKPASGGGNSTSGGATVSLGHCTDDDPSHVGVLDPSQQWHASKPLASGEAFTLSNAEVSMCLDPLGSTKPPALKQCADAPDMQWT